MAKEGTPGLGFGAAGDVRGDDLEIEIDGRTYTGWIEVAVTRSIDQAAGSFRLKAVPSVSETWPVRPLQEVEVSIGGVPVVTGYVDGLAATSSKDGRSVVVTGRDRAADLVDSSAVAEPGEYANLRVHEIAAAIAEPYDVEVLAATSQLGDPFPIFKVSPGETAWSSIERAVRLRALVAYSNGRGQILIDRAGHGGISGGELREGRDGNIFESSLQWALADRFRIYIVRGQTSGTDQTFGIEASEIEGRAFDLEIDRPRALLVLAEGQVSIQDATDRAQWEAAIRRSRSLTVEVKVNGWRQFPTGDPWTVNESVSVSIPSLGIEAWFTIRALRFSRGTDRGAVTTLSLVPEGALDPKPEIPAGAEPFDGILDELEDDSWD